MPAKRSRLKCRHVFTLVAVLFLVPAGADAQTGGVTMKTTVSETVALSALPDSTQGDVNANVVTSGNTVRITLSGAGADTRIIRVPLLVRSNSSFKISAAVESNTAEVTQLSVIEARATGTLVSSQAITELNVPRQFDVRGLDETSSVPNPLDLSRPVLVASGPRVSRGGTLVSPNNALQITLLIRLQPQPAHDWSAHLTFVATAGSPIQ
jgi:hypothetical protein